MTKKKNILEFLSDRELHIKNPSGFTKGCICLNCGNRWSEVVEWPYVIKNSLYESNECEKCFNTSHPKVQDAE